MGLIRTLLLAGSESRWMRRHASQIGIVRKGVSRFMPGEHLDDALTAAAGLNQLRIGAVLTQLGENVTGVESAAAVTEHYLIVLAACDARGLDAHISIKPTQLGLDVDQEQCYVNLRTLARDATARGRFLWIDMEQHRYVDRTLGLYRRARAESLDVGVCLQAYLYRTATDLASLLPLGGGIRLVKGAYHEPPDVAYPARRDVDRNFLELSTRLVSSGTAAAGLRAVFGTHDQRLIARIGERIEASPEARARCEFHLLFGIRQATQRRLAHEGFHVRVLVSYGDQWFPWYMRRLAERPANLLFVARSIWSR